VTSVSFMRILDDRYERREFLRRAAAGVASAAVAGRLLSDSAETALGATRPKKVLLAYFSRAGQQYYYGRRKYVTVGNTEVLARMIADRVRCDVHRILPVRPYSTLYEPTVARNWREIQANARPAIANPLPSIDQYDTILLGCPVWASQAPMIMWTFGDSYDFSGKTVLPFVTYAVSELGSVPDDYRRVCKGARIGTGLAVQGERVQQGARAAASWVRQAHLPTRATR